MFDETEQPYTNVHKRHEKFLQGLKLGKLSYFDFLSVYTEFQPNRRHDPLFNSLWRGPHSKSIVISNHKQ